jgi:hypothetical protein
VHRKGVKALKAQVVDRSVESKVEAVIRKRGRSRVDRRRRRREKLRLLKRHPGA